MPSKSHWKSRYSKLSKLTGILESQELCEKEPEEEIGTWVCWNKFCTLSVKWLNSYWLTKITWRSKRFIRRRKINYKMYFIHPRWGKKTALVYHGLQQHQISRSKTFVTKVVRFTLQCCLMEASSQVQTNQDTYSNRLAKMIYTIPTGQPNLPRAYCIRTTRYGWRTTRN